MESGTAELESAIGQLSLAEHAFEDFPGAVLLVDRHGGVRGLNPGARTVLATTPPKAWSPVVEQVRAMLDRGGAAVEVLSLDPPVEAVLVPLAGRDAALLLLRKQALEANLREALIESRQRFKSLVEISSDFAWETDADGVFVFVSPQGALGWTAAALLGRRAQEFLLDPSDFQAHVFCTEKPIADMDVWFRRADGGTACLGVAAVPVLDEAGTCTGARGVCRDLTADRARDQALARARLRDRLMAHIVRTMRDEIEPARALSAAVSAVGLAVGASGGAVLRRRVDGSAEEAARWGETAPQAVLGAAAARLATADDVDTIEDGRCFAGMATRYRGAANGALMLWRAEADGAFSEPDRAIIADVADHLGIAIAQVTHHESIVQLSRVDPLTGLLNRRAFLEELERRLGTPETAARPGALLYLDLDNFKQLNDSDGHSAGDEALQAFAQILRENTRSADLVARLGGDEFIVWMQSINSAVAETRSRAILRAFGVLTPRIGSAEHPLSVSMGLALYGPDSGETPTALVTRADRAMYAAKEAGKGQLRFAAAHPVDGKALSA